ncbi:hypothetical protein N431DRAFT_426003, partial [Stipitochalara longipes BDJ]
MPAAIHPRTTYPNAFNLPLDLNHPLSPNRALSIHLPSPLTTHKPSSIQDLTSRLPSLYSPTQGITNEHLLSAHKATIASPSPPINYVLEKQNLIGTHLAILDAEGNEIAEWRLPILRLGRGVGNVVEVKFPHGGGEAEIMEMRKLTEGKGKERDKEVPVPASVHHHHIHQRHAESFVKDGIAFLWEAEPEALCQKALFKVVHDENGKARKREVARFGQQNLRDREGLLVLDAREVDELIVVLTICAMVEAKDSFL